MGYGDKIKMLRFWSSGAKTVEGRELIGMVQGDDGMGRPSDLVYDCFKVVKPTYYYDGKGEPVDYITHAQFIANNSFQIYGENGGWCYPMLTFEDKGDFYAVTLRITHYELKPSNAPKLEKETK